MVVDVQAIRDTVNTLGIKQRSFASQIGMTENAVTRLFANRRKLLADEYVKICNALGVPYGSFLVQENKGA